MDKTKLTLASAKTQISTLDAKVEELTGVVATFEGEKKSLNDTIASKDAEITALTEKNKELSDSVATATSEKETLEASNKELTDKVAKLEAKDESAEKKAATIVAGLGGEAIENNNEAPEVKDTLYSKWAEKYN